MRLKDGFMTGNASLLIVLTFLVVLVIIPSVKSQNFIGNITTAAAAAGESRPWYGSSNVLCKSESTGIIHLVWFNNSNTIAYSNSSNNGTTWGIPQRLQNNTDTNSKGLPTLTCENSVVAIAYQDNLSFPAIPSVIGQGGVLQVGISVNNGQTFTWTRPATSNVSSNGTSIDMFNGNIWVVWLSSNAPNATQPGNRIRVTNTSNNGTTWSAPVEVMNASLNANMYPPSIAVDSSGIPHIIAINGSGLPGLNYANRTSGAWPINYLDDNKIISPAYLFPSITTNGTNRYVVAPLSVVNPNNPHIVFTNSSNSGASWEAPNYYSFNYTVSGISAGGLTIGKNGEIIYLHSRINNSGFLPRDSSGLYLDTPLTGLFLWNTTAMYFVGTTNDRVYRVNPQTGISDWGNVNVTTYEGTPTGVCYNGSYFFVTGSSNDRIIRFDSAGTFDWNMRNITSNESTPMGIWCNSSTIYLVGSGGDKIRGYYTNGTEILTGNGTVWNYSINTQEPSSTGLTYSPAMNHFYVTGPTSGGALKAYDGYGQYLGINISLNYSVSTTAVDVAFNGTNFFVLGGTISPFSSAGTISGTYSVYIFNATGGAQGGHLAYIYRNSTGGNTNYRNEWIDPPGEVFNNPIDPYRNVTVAPRYYHDGRVHYAYIRYNATTVFGGPTRFGIYYDYLDLWAPDPITNLANDTIGGLWFMINYTAPASDWSYTEVWYNLTNGTFNLYANTTQPVNYSNITGIPDGLNVTVTVVPADYLGQKGINTTLWVGDRTPKIESLTMVGDVGNTTDTNWSMTYNYYYSTNNYTFWSNNTRKVLLAYSFNSNFTNSSRTVVNHGSWGTNGTKVTSGDPNVYYGLGNWWDNNGMDGSGSYTQSDTNSTTYARYINTSRNDNIARPFTVCASVRPDSFPGTGANHGIVSKWDSGTSERSWMLFVTTNATGTYWRLGSSSTGADSSSGYSNIITGGVDVWYDLCLVYTTSDQQLYVNGTFDKAYTPSSTTIFSSTVPISVGGFQVSGAAGGQTGNMTIDNVMIYNWSMSAMQIKERYDSIVGRRPIRLMMDETTPDETWTGTVIGSNTVIYSDKATITQNIGSGAVDPCAYGGSGDFTIDCTNNCIWISTIDVGANNFFASGAGVITGLRYIINSGTGHNPAIMHLDGGCIGRW